MYKQKNSKYRRKLLSLFIAILFIFSVIIIVRYQYIKGKNKYNVVFMDNTVINGFDVSGMSIDEVNSLLMPELNKFYSLEIVFINGTETITNGKGSLNISLCEPLENVLKNQNSSKWFIENKKRHEIIINYNKQYDKELMKEYLSGLSYMQTENMEKPTNATVIMQDGEVVIVPEAYGTMLDLDKAYAAIFYALDNNLTSIDLFASGCYEKPIICSEDEVILDMEKKADSFLNIHAVYNIGGETVEITREELSKLGYIDGTGHISVSKREVDRFIRELDSKYYNTGLPSDNREFITQDGKTVNFYCGKSITKINTDKEAVYLYNLLTAGEDFERSPVMVTVNSGMNKRALGEQYVEVNLTRQRVYLISDGEVVFETACVSGNVPSYQSTPSGIYAFNSKATNVILRGRTYESYVNYWMPFFGDFGLHDATWRDEFGNDIYLKSGSHGCINLPIEAAEIIYNFVKPGMTIVLYWESEPQ